MIFVANLPKVSSWGQDRMKKLISTILVLFMAVGCSEDGDVPQHLMVSGSYQVQEEDYVFTVNIEKYQEVNFNRQSDFFCTDQLNLKKVRRQGSELTLELTKPATCEGKLELLWDGTVWESNPKKIQIYLIARNNSCPPTDELVTEVIKVDLAKCIGNYSALMPFNIYLREFCSYRDYDCIGNCDMDIPD